ncbi:MAG: glycosyltransferase family protein [Elusimicrobiales bacterium]
MGHTGFRSACKRCLTRSRLLSRLYAGWKAGRQERAAFSEESHYARLVREKGIVLPDEAGLAGLLARRLAGRGLRPAPKKRGELHIFAAYGRNNWESVIPETLKGFGKVSEFSWDGRQFDADSLAIGERRTAMNAELSAAFDSARAAAPVDAVVGYFSGYTATPELLSRLAAGGVIFNFCWDDKLYFKGPTAGARHLGQVDLVPSVDLNLTNAPSSLPKYFAEGGLALFWPEGASPERQAQGEAPFDFDVSFVGKKYGWRGDFILDLRRRGVRVECFGQGWENGPMDDREMVRLYARSRINLGFAGVGYSRRLMCLKGRDFEVPMSGGLYLTQANPELSLVYEVGREIETYSSPADCAEKIKSLLGDPQRASAIRAAGRARALKDHTWHKRFETIFSLSGLLA